MGSLSTLLFSKIILPAEATKKANLKWIHPDLFTRSKIVLKKEPLFFPAHVAGADK